MALRQARKLKAAPAGMLLLCGVLRGRGSSGTAGVTNAVPGPCTADLSLSPDGTTSTQFLSPPPPAPIHLPA